MEDAREKGFAVATNFWLDAGSKMLQQQASLLRLWADAIDKYENYEQGTEKLRSHPLSAPPNCYFSDRQPGH
jgi:hypothetical protein